MSYATYTHHISILHLAHSARLNTIHEFSATSFGPLFSSHSLSLSLSLLLPFLVNHVQLVGPKRTILLEHDKLSRVYTIFTLGRGDGEWGGEAAPPPHPTGASFPPPPLFDGRFHEMPPRSPHDSTWSLRESRNLSPPSSSSTTTTASSRGPENSCPDRLNHLSR